MGTRVSPLQHMMVKPMSSFSERFLNLRPVSPNVLDKADENDGDTSAKTVVRALPTSIVSRNTSKKHTSTRDRTAARCLDGSRAWRASTAQAS
jgi:hypothetical protein